jgi:hypothetical protein
MTIYLLKKTHAKTGLMYLCKTVRNPFKYKGSGKDWIPHLAQYGDDHYTEIVMECQSKEEFKYWGRYYSRLWNIVNAQDDFGNKIWANQKIEGGDGGSRPNPSLETRAKRSSSVRATWARMSQEDLAKQSALRKAGWANMTPADRADHSANISATRDKMTPEAKADHLAKIQATRLKWTPEERANLSANLSAAIRAGKARKNSSLS